MANRRMFSNRIANSAKFLQMPSEAQLLYFHLILRADDDGIVESYPIMKLLGLAPDNFTILKAKRFIEVLNEDQVVVITDWHEHNTIRADRKVNSIYIDLLRGKIPELSIVKPKQRSDVKDNSKRIGGQSTDSLSKVKLGKVKLIKNTPVDIPPCIKDVETYCKERNNKINGQHFIDFYEAKGWMIGKNKMKSWKAAIRTWEQRDGRGSVITDPTHQKYMDKFK